MGAPKMIKGITIQLIDKIDTGATDELNRTIYQDEIVNVDNVLVAPSSGPEIIDSVNLYGKKALYTLGIPKGDTHVWEDKEVILPEPFAGRYRVIGYPTAGIDAMIPLQWNKKVLLERYG